ncbi:hypothetical protein CRE_10434 [Caenorhabditis remanei]|uniref:Uncharacterized protein n=1 Tax=Caenorhabditis remanei TaxID=31234 RepID=E3N0V6_CAERE|nr:hypothetical protein CRE_10434 [Caenorhabditis remanei]
MSAPGIWRMSTTC